MRKIYIAVDDNGDVYAGQTANIAARTSSHKRDGRHVVESFDVTPGKLFLAEKRMIHFLANQAEEEEFSCTNVCKRK